MADDLDGFSQLFETEDSHLLIIENMFNKLFPDYNKNYELPIAIKELIVEYSSFDMSKFFDLNQRFSINIFDTFSNIPKEYFTDNVDENGMIDIKIRNSDRLQFQWNKNEDDSTINIVYVSVRIFSVCMTRVTQFNIYIDGACIYFKY